MGALNQVRRVTTRISRHQVVPDIPLDDLGNGQLDGKEWQITNESQSFRATLRDAAGQLVQHGWAGNQFVVLGRTVPSLLGPLPARHNARGATVFVVEAGDCGFNIYAEFGHPGKIPH